MTTRTTTRTTTTSKTSKPSKTPSKPKRKWAAWPVLKTDANGFFFCEARYTQRDPTRGT